MTMHDRPHVLNDQVDALPDVDLDRVWSRVGAEIWASPVGRVETAASRLLGHPALARALVTTPSLLVSWIIASALVFALGAVVAQSAAIPVIPLIAPVLATIGIAWCYGAGADPAHELMRTMSIPAGMLLLVRVVAVFAVNTLLAMAAALIVPTGPNLPALWFLPMVAIALLGLAVATLTHSAPVGAGTGLGAWVVILGIGEVRTETFSGALTSSALSASAPLYVLLTLAAVLTLVLTNADLVNWRGSTKW